MFAGFSVAEKNIRYLPTKLRDAVLYTNPAKDLTLPTKLSNDSGGNSYSDICGDIVTTYTALNIGDIQNY
jgi:hypothetical protein